jgi:hypothetical protein
VSGVTLRQSRKRGIALFEKVYVVRGVEGLYFFLGGFAWSVDVHVSMHAISEDKVVGQRQPMRFLSSVQDNSAIPWDDPLPEISRSMERHIQSGSSPRLRDDDTSHVSTMSAAVSVYLWLGRSIGPIVENAVV